MVIVFSSGITDVAADTTFKNNSTEPSNYSSAVSSYSELVQRLNDLINKYNNTTWTSGGTCDHYGKHICYSKCYSGYQCKAFASYIFNELFKNGNIGAYDETTGNGYKIKNPSGATLVGRAAGFAETDTATVQKILSQAKTGDFIQVKRRNRNIPHSMIVKEVNSNGITIFDANYMGQCLVAVYDKTWQKLANENEAFSLYHATNYPAGESQPTSFTVDTLKNNDTVSGTGYTIAGTFIGASSNKSVRIYVDYGNIATVTPADGRFSYSLDTTKFKNGSHVISVKFLDSSGLDYSNHYNVTFGNHNPIGGVSTLTGGYSKIELSGWAFDYDNLDAKLEIHVYLDGSPVKGLTSNIVNSKITSLYPQVDSSHGFSGEFPVGTVGEHQISVYAINVGDGNNICLYSNPVYVKPSNGISDIPEDTYYIKPYATNNSAIDIYGGYTDDGVNVQLAAFHGRDNQKFQLKNCGDGRYQIIAAHSGKCLATENYSKNNRANVIQATINNTINSQKWIFVDAGDGYYNIYNSSSGRCLDLYGGYTADETNIQLFNANGTNAQKWKLVSTTNAGKTEDTPKDTTVSSSYLGDLNYDGKITAVDLSTVAQAANGKITLSDDDKKRADVNGDGKITKEDVELVQQYIVGQIREFPAENMLMDIVITKAPNKITYYVGERLSTTGMQVMAVYGNNTRKEITDYEVSLDTSKAGDSEIVVAYMEGDIIKSTSYKITVLENHTHSYTGTVTKNATCSSTGSIIYKCSCGSSYTKTIPKTGHVNKEVRNSVTATCGETGYTGDIYCKDCGTKLESGNVIEKLPHDYSRRHFIWYDNWKKCKIRFICSADSSHKIEYDTVVTSVVKKEPTCITKGKTRYFATYMDGDIKRVNRKDVADIDIDKNNHEGAVELRNVKAATCTENGYTGDTYCLSCGELIEAGTIIAAKGHTWNTGTITQPATCTSEGEKQSACTICGTTKTETIPANGHAITEIRNQKEATCSETGYTGDIYCKECGTKIETGKTIDKTDHQYMEPSFEWSADGKSAKAVYTCKTNKNHVIKCDAQVIAEIIEEPTCSTEGTTLYTAVSNEYSDEMEVTDIPVDKTSHTGETIIKNAKKATFQTTGYTGDTYCKDCGAKLSDGEEIAKLSGKQQRIIVNSKFRKTVVKKASALKKKKFVYYLKAKAKGTLTYEVTKGSSKYISVSKNGIVTLRKGCKKGIYKITITAAETANGEFRQATKIITFKIK